MKTQRKGLLGLGLVAAITLAGAGCSPSYQDQRPDPSKLNSDDSGLQSRDVIVCTNQMVSDLLANQKLNSSATQWTLAVGSMDDQTRDRMFATNYDIFTEALRSAISEKAQGRIQLIENAANFNKMRSQELEQGNPDQYGQGGNPGGAAPAPLAVNPDYMLYGKAIDMPNRSTNFYLLQFNVVNMHTRTMDWSRTYQVKVSR